MNDDSTQRLYNSRLGMRLLILYSLVYFAFVLVNGFLPELAEWKPAGGVNLAIWWGFGLIGLAFVLAMVYGLYCRDEQSIDDSRSPLPQPGKGELAASPTKDEEHGT